MKIKNIIKHDLFKSSLIYTICDATNKSVPFFILPILSYYLLPADYGVVANFGILSGVITILINFSIDGAISVNFHKLKRDQIRQYIFNAIIISFSIFLLLLFLNILLQEWIYNIVKIPYKYQKLCICVCLFNVFTSLNLILWRLEEKPLFFGMYEISNTVINLLLSVFFVIYLKLGWEGRINALLLTSIIYGSFSLFFLFKRKYLKLKLDKNYLRDVMLFSLPLIPHSLSFWLRSGIDRAFISKFWGVNEVGLYATGFIFGTFISFLMSAFNNAFSPYLYKTLSRATEEELPVIKGKMVKMTYMIMIGLLISGLVFFVLSNLILNYWFDPKYKDSSEYIFWAILGQIFQGFYILFVNYIFFAKKTKQLASITFCCALLHVAMSYILVKSIGPIGAAYSSTAVAAINFIFVAIYSAKAYPMPWNKLINLKRTDKI